MRNRSVSELQRDQAKILDDYQSRLPARGAGSATAMPTTRPALQWGRVIQVVTSDENFGPHLVVQAYVYTGSPPSPTPSVAAPFPCYPVPGKTVGDYAVDDYVRLTTVPGAVIAERIN